MHSNVLAQDHRVVGADHGATHEAHEGDEGHEGHEGHEAHETVGVHHGAAGEAHEAAAGRHGGAGADREPMRQDKPILTKQKLNWRGSFSFLQANCCM